MFLGSPLRSGPSLTATGRTALLLWRISGKKPWHQLRQHLESDTGVLRQLLQDFSATVVAKELRIPIRCFHELRTTKKKGFKDFVSENGHSSTDEAYMTQVVDRDAACIDGHTHIGLDANHTMMSKFYGPDDKNYEFVSAEIRHLVKNHTSVLCERSGIDERPRAYESNEHRDCHRAFKTSSYESFKNINPPRVPGTCLWVLEDPKYEMWHRNKRDNLL